MSSWYLTLAAALLLLLVLTGGETLLGLMAWLSNRTPSANAADEATEGAHHNTAEAEG